MKQLLIRFKWPIIVLLSVVQLFVSAREVSTEEVCQFARQWIAENQKSLGGMRAIDSAIPQRNKQGKLLYYLVRLSPQGGLVIAADTQVDPILMEIRHLPDEVDQKHPLWDMLQGDMENRLGWIAKANQRPVPNSKIKTMGIGNPHDPMQNVRRSIQEAESCWNRFLKSGQQSSSSLLAVEENTSSEEKWDEFLLYEWRVPVCSHWNQGANNNFVDYRNDEDEPYLYNKYTPNHYPAGCVAVAGAQLLQYYKIPWGPFNYNDREIEVDGEKQFWSLMDAWAYYYNWSVLPKRWEKGIRLAPEAIDFLGTVAYDMGLCIGSSYREYATSSTAAKLAKALHDDYAFAAAYHWEVDFQQASSQNQDGNLPLVGGAEKEEQLAKLHDRIEEWLRGFGPVMLGIRKEWGGHAVLGVGIRKGKQQFIETTPPERQVYISQGCGGAYDGWYTLPRVEEYYILRDVVFASPSATSRITGRVYDWDSSAFIPGVVYCAGHEYPFVTDFEGRFGVNVPYGNYAVVEVDGCRSDSIYTGDIPTSNAKEFSFPDPVYLDIWDGRSLNIYSDIEEAWEEAKRKDIPLVVFRGPEEDVKSVFAKIRGLFDIIRDQFIFCYLNYDSDDPYFGDATYSGNSQIGIFDINGGQAVPGWGKSLTPIKTVYKNDFHDPLGSEQEAAFAEWLEVAAIESKKVPECSANLLCAIEGTRGKGKRQMVNPGEWLEYTIHFENPSDAKGDLRESWVTNPLSEYLDWSTFEMGSIRLGQQADSELEGKASGTSMIWIDDKNFYLSTKVAVDTNQGIVQWHLQVTEDPWGDYYPPVNQGFLPPNDPLTHCGEGGLTYRIKVRDNAPAGVVITNQVSLMFNTSETLVTPPEAWLNTVWGEGMKFNLSLPESDSERGTVKGTSGGYGAGENILVEAQANPGFRFAGWYLDKQYTTPLNAECGDYRRDHLSITMSYDDLTLYAKFVPVKESGFVLFIR